MKIFFKNADAKVGAATPDGEPLANVPAPEHARRSASKNLLRRAVAVGFGLGLLLTFGILLSAETLREWTLALLPDPPPAVAGSHPIPERFTRDLRRMESRIAVLRNRFIALTPREPYLIVDTSENRILLMAGAKLLHEGLCSTGSYVLLRASNNRQWIFQTPRGMFRIYGKVEAPVWKMPDWAFVEEGRAVPPPDSDERFEAGVLGEYGLSFGDGYLIHGTLYKRMLGMPVTHGCIRLDDEELRIVYHNLQIGSKIFIY